MTAFQDMIVTMDRLIVDGNRAVYQWTLVGTNTGPGETGNAVRISGYEEWTIGADWVIIDSQNVSCWRGNGDFEGAATR